MRSMNCAKTLSPGRAQNWVIGILLLAGLYAALAYGLYNGLTARAPGANDFFSRWMGARALILRGQNPYSEEVTREIQLGMYGRLAEPDEDQVAFAYPLYAAYLAAPVVGLPYPAAQALWMAMLVIAVVAGALALAVLNRVVISPLALAAIVLCALIFYPSVRGIFLGQYVLVSFALIALASLAIARGHETTAGILLALASVKPQPVILLLPCILFWAWWNGKRSVVWSALATLALLIGSSFLWVPTWFGDFLGGLRNYAEYLPIGPPAETLARLLLPQPLATYVTFAVGVVLVVWMVVMVWRNRNAEWLSFQPSLGFVALVTTLIAVRIGSPDQELLLILWMAWLSAWCMAKRRLWVAAAVVFLLLAPWYVFLTTIQGNQEALVVSTILPWFTLGVMILLSLLTRRKQRAAR